jgi:hypothetical protein
LEDRFERIFTKFKYDDFQVIAYVYKKQRQKYWKIVNLEYLDKHKGYQETLVFKDKFYDAQNFHMNTVFIYDLKKGTSYFEKLENLTDINYNLLAKRARFLSNPSWKLVSHELLEFYSDLQVAIRYGNDLYRANSYREDVVALRNKHTKEFIFIHLESLKVALKVD